MEYHDGSVYLGKWEKDQKHGKGKYTLKGDTAEYDGEWKDGKKDGNAEVRYHDGSKYKGQFENDFKSGHGVYTTHDGRTHDGNWKEGKKHGPGVQKDAEGNVERKGDWHENKYVTK